MAIGSGLASQIGIAAETTYGTYVAPTRFVEFQSESLTGQKATYQGGGLAGGQFQQRGSRRVVTTRSGAGNLTQEVTTNKMGVFLANLMGGSATPVQQGATAAYLQSHVIGDNYGKSLTIQKGVSDTTGTVRPYSFLGGKITSAEFSCAAGESLMVSMDMDFRDVTEAQVLATASYTPNTPFSFSQMTVKLGTYGAETSVTGVRGVSITIERPMAVERYYAGASGLKAEPIMNDYLAVSGSFDTDFVDKTIFADRFASDSSTSLVLEWVGANIASTYYQTFRIKVPMIFIDESTPQVGGPDVVAPSYSFTGQFDGTNPTTIEYISTDTTL